MDSMNSIMALASILTPVITGVIQVAKNVLTLPKNWLPLFALIIGVILGLFAFVMSDLDLAHRLWAGGLAGLGSVGFFEVFNNRSGTTNSN